MNLSSLITDDSRTPIEKLRRHQLQQIAMKAGIKFDPAGPATNLRKLIEGSGIDVTKEAEFNRIHVKTEDGMVKEILDPVIKPHATANANIDYSSIIEERASKEKENEDLRNEINELKAMIASLIPKKSDLKEQYKAKFGTYPRGKMKEETIKEKLGIVNG